MDSARYVPVKQLLYCCVPACLQIVFAKNHVAQMPQRELAMHLDVRVPPEEAYHFDENHVGNPEDGYGVPVDTELFRPNDTFEKLDIPLRIDYMTIDTFDNPDALREALSCFEAEDTDIILCMKWSGITDNLDEDHGHVCVFDRIVDGKIRFIDPYEEDLFRIVSPEKMYDAMTQRGGHKKAGLWIFENV